MNKGICFHFGYVYNDIEQQVKDIKDAGFNCVITNADPKMDCENGTIKQQVKLFKKYGLKLSSLHMRYERSELPHFWHDNPIGNKLERNLKKDVKLAKKYGFKCVVVHLRGEPNEIGYNRLRRILKLCEKVKIPLAIENIGDKYCFDKTFENVDSEYLRFCYDSGHNHAFDPQVDYLSTYGNKLIALHLHDNLGPNQTAKQLKGLTYKKPSLDMHTLNKYGNIDWCTLANKLSKIDYPLSLDYEVMMVYRKDENAKDVLNEVMKQAKELENLINQYKDKSFF
ncbi:MAG: sugar phosphate isomerase/epimerase [Clostridia bacterium]|nr:sugar phosphate isomerase/epimerase [Clostridia bacterium]